MEVITNNKYVQRNFMIGDSWIYYKIYCGAYTADDILVKAIHPIVSDLLKNNIIEKWFFIRYNDPENHIRIRILLRTPDQLNSVIQKVKTYLAPFINSQEIWDVQLHTYKRELERYGTNTMSISESLFFYDSEIIINGIANIPNETEYFLFIIKIVFDHLSLFNYEDQEKMNFISSMRNGYRKEFNTNKTTTKSLDAKYRSLKEKIHKILGFNNSDLSYTTKNNELNYKNIKTTLVSYKKEGNLLVDSNELLASYIHMTINRSFKSKQRLYELMIYDILYRVYKTKIALK
ncbi:thiopeptide-type bacteriocin biosynthesis protein [Tenacibaculum sp. MAR_2009_124]|uniref:thiopeptide-type bacteriocin biosynthesis protein n=1 Tax=Tenacibaculum sp. MAR_2009_124 TaxID=1250059 RepID=UPI000AB95F22|nr:thiopeptide-type bacteriocin biosynthesis protein [Tenacibaculum sp. MAR_2009_124]